MTGQEEVAIGKMGRCCYLQIARAAAISRKLHNLAGGRWHIVVRLRSRWAHEAVLQHESLAKAPRSAGQVSSEGGGQTDRQTRNCVERHTARHTEWGANRVSRQKTRGLSRKQPWWSSGGQTHKYPSPNAARSPAHAPTPPQTYAQNHAALPPPAPPSHPPTPTPPKRR